MRKKFSRILGMAIVLIMVLSLLTPLAAVAGANKWTTETIMSYSGTVYTKTISPSDIPALASDSEGDALYAIVAGDAVAYGFVYKSTDGGQIWTKLDHTTAPDKAVALAVAPDDPQYVIAADNDAEMIYISANGGSTWSSSSMTTAFSNGGYGAMICVDISVPDSAGTRWVAVGGNTATPTAVIQVAKVATFATGVDGILGTSGSDTGFQTAATYVRAVKFSPMLDYDDTFLAVSVNGTSADTSFQAANLVKIADATGNASWNASGDFGTGYPVELISGTGTASASMALPDTYDGVEPTARVVYIATPNNVFRTDNTTITTVRTGNFPALAYNSADNMLLIGAGASTSVKMSANPDTTTPTFTTALRYKYPSGDHVSALAWVGSTMVCATTGGDGVDESALSVSTDARSWNQVSLIDTDLADMTDVAVSADGATIYLASVQQDNASIWRYASGWERIFCDDIDSDLSAGDVLVRIVPGDPDHILIGEVGGDEIRVSTNGGDTWKRSKAKITIVDIVVEDEDTVYVLGSTKVSKSTDGGFHFATGKKTTLTADTNAHMVVANGDVLVVGEYASVVTVAYSDDGGATFSRTAKTTGIAPESGKPILIAADKDYATNSVIFVACNEAISSDNKIMRWAIGAGAEEWKSRGPSATVLDDAYWFTGLGYFGGALYATAMQTDSSTHVFSLNPGDTSPTWGTVASAYIPTAEFGCAPQALKFSSGSSKMWAVDIDGATADRLFSFADTISAVVVAPTLLAPAAGYVGSVDVVLERIDPIRFSWEQVHKDVGYQLQIGTNEAMTLNTEYYYPASIAPGTENAEYITVGDGTTIADNEYPLIAGETYYWRVRVNYPIRGAFSEVRSFTIEEAVAAPVEVTVEVPPVEVTVEAPAVSVEAPMVTVPAPVITVEAPAAADITVEMPPAEVPPTPGYIWSIIAIGAVLVIAMIILIVRTRRVA